MDAQEVLTVLGAKWSPDFDAFAEGRIDADQSQCVLCGQRPCNCPDFGTPEYFDLLNRLHGRSK